MRSEYSKWFWSECDELNKDTSFAHSLAEKAWNYRQTEVDELQRRNQMLNDNIKEQGQKLVYQNEVIETQAEKLLCLRDEKEQSCKKKGRCSKNID